MRKRRLPLIETTLFLLGLLAGLYAHAAPAADEAPPTKTLSFETLESSSAFQENRNEILSVAHAKVAGDDALSPEEKAAIDRELDQLGNSPLAGGKRTLDLEVSFLSGFPDTIGICLEAFPTRNERLVIEGCASSAIFISSLTANVLYRWKIRETVGQNGRSTQLSIGPGGGFRAIEALCFDACGSAKAINAFGSLEYVRWVNQRFGWGLQLDFGVMMPFARRGSSINMNPVLPDFKLTLGFNFRKSRR